MSPTTAGSYVDELVRAGLLLESGLEKGPMGRPKKTLSTNPDVGWFAGIEFNAERIQGVAIDFSGEQQHAVSTHLPPKADAAVVMAEIVTMVSRLMTELSSPLLAIGVGAPGVIDPVKGVGVQYTFLSRWQQVPVSTMLRDRFMVPVILEHNMRAIAQAERWFGGGRELENYVILGPRSGFGIAMVEKGQLVKGKHFAAGEIGRWAWPLGTSGHHEMQDALSATAVWRRLSGTALHEPHPTDLHKALRTHATEISRAYNSVVEDYAQVLSLLHLLLDSGTYFLHGPLTALGERFCHQVADCSARNNPALRDSPPKIIPSALGDEAGALGAATHAMEAWLPSLP